MTSELNFKGFWWTPDQPTNKFPGDLEVDQSGTLVLTILVNQNYADYFINESSKSKKIQIINGYARDQITKKDLAFSLFDNSIYSSHVSGLAEFKIQSRFAVTTKFFKTINEFKLGSAFIELKLLDEWVSVSGINIKHKATRKFKFTVDYSQPRPITLLKRKEYHLYLWFYAKTNSTPKDFKIEQRPRINIDFKKEKRFEEFIKLYELIKNFFSFCISVPVTSNEIELFELSNTSFRRLGLNHQNAKKLIISDTRTYTKRTTLQSNVMLIDYEKIKGKEGEIIGKWLELNEKYEPAFKLYFDTLYNPDLYTQNAFLNYVSAFEIYHRIQNPDFDGKDEQYNKKITSALNEIKNLNKRKMIEAKLKKRKESKLLSRLDSMVKRTPKISARLAVDNFCSKVSNTRNYFTHFSQENRKKAITDSKGLFELMFKMRIYLQVQILLDLGFSETEADLMTKKAISNWFEWNR